MCIYTYMPCIDNTQRVFKLGDPKPAPVWYVHLHSVFTAQTLVTYHEQESLAINKFVQYIACTVWEARGLIQHHPTT